jgi:hypothetical protein
MINTLDDFICEFRKIQEMGWIKTHRSGPTGIGKTLEDLLGIPENNAGEPDFGTYELKSARLNSNSMLTLFTLAPQPPKANRILLEKYGYKRNGKTVLRSTLSTENYSSVNLKMTIKGGRIYFESKNDGIIQIYYEKTALMQALERKYSDRLVYAYAERKGSKANEHFKFHSAYTIKMDYEAFFDLLAKGVIKVDVRLGLYPDGRTHDHGTGFRIKPRDQVLLFKEREQIV